MRIDYRFPDLKHGGFGNLGNGIAKALQEAGHVLTSDNPDILLRYGPPDVMSGSKSRTTPMIYYTVWESSEYPDLWADCIKEHKPELVLTATEFTKESLARCGIKAEVWHHAVNDMWQYKERSGSTCRFIHWNAYEWRKGWEIALMAFKEEFGEDEDVELILLGRDRGQAKFIDDDGNIDFGHSKIKEVLGALPNDKLYDLITSCDVGVFPVKGEGWFMPSQEFAATGGTPILPRQMGLVEQWVDGYVDVGIAGYINASPRYPGYMMIVDTDDLRKQMRWCFNNVPTLRKSGRALSERVRNKFNWGIIIKELEYYLNSIIKK